MLETNLDMTDVGSGLCVVKNALQIDQQFLFDYIDFLKKAEEETFTYIEENGIKYAINKTGFKFAIDQVSLAPERFVDVLGVMNNRPVTQEQKKFIETLEDLMYRILVEYCKHYPDAATVCWWRRMGHIATYSNGQGIGPHCDDQIAYEYKKSTQNEYPKHSKVSVNIYLNDSVDTVEELNGYNFIGGHITHRHAKHTHKPKSGSAVIYPANFIGTHEVSPVTHGKRVAYLGAFLYGTPDNASENDGRIWLPNLKKDAGLEF
jgi:hypothetical protein